MGAFTETVTVEGTAPLIEASTDQISETFSAEKVSNLPMGNSFDSLAMFIPGVATAWDASFSNNNGAEISVNGQRARSNNFQRDGQSNNDNSVAGPQFSSAIRMQSLKYKSSLTMTLRSGAIPAPGERHHQGRYQPIPRGSIRVLGGFNL